MNDSSINQQKNETNIESIYPTQIIHYQNSNNIKKYLTIDNEMDCIDDTNDESNDEMNVIPFQLSQNNKLNNIKNINENNTSNNYNFNNNLIKNNNENNNNINFNYGICIIPSNNININLNIRHNSNQCINSNERINNDININNFSMKRRNSNSPKKTNQNNNRKSIIPFILNKIDKSNNELIEEININFENTPFKLFNNHSLLKPTTKLINVNSNKTINDNVDKSIVSSQIKPRIKPIIRKNNIKKKAPEDNDETKVFKHYFLIKLLVEYGNYKIILKNTDWKKTIRLYFIEEIIKDNEPLVDYKNNIKNKTYLNSKNCKGHKRTLKYNYTNNYLIDLCNKIDGVIIESCIFYDKKFKPSLPIKQITNAKIFNKEFSSEKIICIGRDYYSKISFSRRRICTLEKCIL